MMSQSIPNGTNSSLRAQNAQPATRWDFKNPSTSIKAAVLALGILLMVGSLISYMYSFNPVAVYAMGGLGFLAITGVAMTSIIQSCQTFTN